MKYLLDTHVFIWIIAGETDRFSGTLIDVLENTENSLFLSTASIWEMMIKCSINRLHFPSPAKDFLKEQMSTSGMVELPVRLEHACEIVNLQPLHKDPFDRMLIAQAKVESMQIITKDSVIPLYDVDVFW